jgi:hypothetical protein
VFDELIAWFTLFVVRKHRDIISCTVLIVDGDQVRYCERVQQVSQIEAETESLCVQMRPITPASRCRTAVTFPSFRQV